VLFVLLKITQSSSFSLVDAFCVVYERDVLRGQYSMAVVGDSCSSVPNEGIDPVSGEQGRAGTAIISPNQWHHRTTHRGLRKVRQLALYCLRISR
jgi:hypothetical protein